MKRFQRTSEQKSHPYAIVRFLLPGLLAQPLRVAFASTCLFLGVLLSIAEPIPLQIVLDSLLLTEGKSVGTLTREQIHSNALGPSLGTLTFCAVSLIVIASLRAMAEYYRTITFSQVGNRVLTDLRGKVFHHMQNLSLDFHQRSRGGDLTVRLTSDINMLKDVTISAALPLLSSAILLIGMVSVMLWLNWRLGILVLIVFPVFAVFTWRGSHKIHKSARQQRKREGALAASAAESIAAVKSLQSYAVGASLSGDFASMNSKSNTEGVRTSRLSAGLERSVDVLIAFASALVLWQGTRYVLDGSLTPGGLVVYLAYLKRGFRPLQDFAKYTGRLSKAMASGERIAEILEQRPAVQDAVDAKVAPAFLGRITFEKVTFGYEPNRPVLRDFSADIQAGERISIVGPSGIGKSTLLTLLLRLYDPWEGRILIDGIDIRTFSLTSLRHQLSVVQQENAIFATTVRENIAFANPTADPSRIFEAARIACADEFILQMPNGFETELGERGVNLSQGQKQRLAIARAAYRSTPILLLDEPTSNLDIESRSRVLSALEKVSHQRTTLMVTHDLELAILSDRVLYLGGDGIYDIGTHSSLMVGCPAYANVWETLHQSKSFQRVSNALPC